MIRIDALRMNICTGDTLAPKSDKAFRGKQGRQVLVFLALGKHHEVLEDDRHAHGADKRSKFCRISERPVGDAFNDRAVGRAKCHGNDDREQE